MEGVLGAPPRLETRRPKVSTPGGVVQGRVVFQHPLWLAVRRNYMGMAEHEPEEAALHPIRVLVLVAEEPHEVDAALVQEVRPLRAGDGREADVEDFELLLVKLGGDALGGFVDRVRDVHERDVPAPQGLLPRRLNVPHEAPTESVCVHAPRIAAATGWAWDTAGGRPSEES